MASGNAVNGKKYRGLTALANAVTGITNASVNPNFTPGINPDDKKVVFIIGMNAASHYILRDVVEKIADLGIHADIYLTDNLPKSDQLKEKLARPETKHFAFHEHLIMDVVDPVLKDFDDNDGPDLDNHGELNSRQQYTPRQLAEYYSGKNVNINVVDMADPNLPEEDRDINHQKFINRIKNDDKIARGFNIRGLQIMSQDLIDAFESHTMNGNKTRIVNAHPGDVFAFPGTNIAFWARVKGYAQNVWTTHVIDKQIDHGPFLRRTAQALKYGKSLMQDMLTMVTPVANLITDDITGVFTNNETPPTPQKQDARFAQKPKDANGKETTYTYATHQEWIDAYNNFGVKIADPEGYIKALVDDFTNQYTPAERKITLLHELAVAMRDEQVRHVQEYKATYGYTPPYFDDNKPDGGYYIDLNKYPPYNQNGPGNQANAAPVTP